MADMKRAQALGDDNLENVAGGSWGKFTKGEYAGKFGVFNDSGKLIKVVLTKNEAKAQSDVLTGNKDRIRGF